MSGILFTLAAFVLALSLLVTVHEFGHFWVARRLGVRVLRFSVGFGNPIWRWQRSPEDVEFVIATIPLGGYVKMLDEREGEVPPEQLDRAFNRKPLAARMAVVVAGPLFNFLFAILVYWMMYVGGVPGVKAVVGEVLPDTPAAEAGLQPRDQLLRVDERETPTWQTAVLALLDGALDHRDLQLEVQGGDGVLRRLTLRLDGVDDLLDRGNLLERLGIRPWRPVLPPVIGKLVAGGAAERAGLRPGDHILSADGQPIPDWSVWVEYVQARPQQPIRLEVERDGQRLQLDLQPERVEIDNRDIGRIGAYPEVPESLGAELRTEIRHGPLEAIGPSLAKTWEMTALTLRTLWKMLVGEASVENISGPISIAQYAGHTASMGLASFLGFLGVVSISLGVLNLLPIPVLDGGHLLYYLIELFKGSPLSPEAELFGQRIGIAILLALMSLAVFNDFSRLLN
ncbi:RIP metalloprotease RseP [Thiohalobacter sp. IOR34]|uniref:RIP metalloprotease RseP n=1 Tax=Thiohalobacter sp. IOR34 TaxID=3057176 RepID=UPI0025B17DD9|nr:RIP metalloprotease RseP [Thiohalobacter sp. IOR34]WJW76581.1 RIP metalloprotease RseP [Thiohalobacter sp. IOR34]